MNANSNVFFEKYSLNNNCIMKKIILLLSLVLMTNCSKNEELNIRETQQIQPEQFGEFHNEAVLGLLNHPDYKPENGVQDNMVIMYQVMSKKHPKVFDRSINIKHYAKELYGSFNENSLNYHSLIKIFKNKEKDINKNIMKYVENSISPIDSKSTSLDEKQLIAFNSVKKASLKLWTVDAPKYLTIEKDYLNKSSCDASSQVIIADAGASLVFWWNPPASIIAGAAASLIVRQDQIQNYNGGCATN